MNNYERAVERLSVKAMTREEVMRAREEDTNVPDKQALEIPLIRTNGRKVGA